MSIVALLEAGAFEVLARGHDLNSCVRRSGLPACASVDALLITSRYTMDKQDSTVRRYLADRSRLLGAVRLPNTTFKANAGTEVTTDIVSSEALSFRAG